VDLQVSFHLVDTVNQGCAFFFFPVFPHSLHRRPVLNEHLTLLVNSFVRVPPQRSLQFSLSFFRAPLKIHTGSCPSINFPPFRGQIRLPFSPPSSLRSGLPPPFLLFHAVIFDSPLNSHSGTWLVIFLRISALHLCHQKIRSPHWLPH